VLIPLALLKLALALAACAGYGAAWLRLLRFPLRRDPLQAIQAIALGMGTLAYLVLAVGLLGWLRAPVLALLVILGWLLLAILGRGWTPQRPSTTHHSPLTTHHSLITPALWAVLGLIGVATLIFAVRPPDGLEWDSLSYHLAAPKIYLHDGKISHLVYDSHTNFPFTMQMLYTLGLAFGGAAEAKLFHWASGWLTALALAVWTPRLDSRLPAWTGPAAAAAFVGMPIVLWEMGTAYVDLGTALFQLLALMAVLDGVRLGEAGQAPVDLRCAALAGVLSGFALGTKATALLQFGLLGLGLLWVGARCGKTAWKPALGAALLFGALGLLVGSPWYLKSWLWVHNPVHPFFYRLFPESFSWNDDLRRAYDAEQRRFGIWTLLRLHDLPNVDREAESGVGPIADLLRPGGVRQLTDVFRLPWDLGLHGRAFYLAPLPKQIVGDQLGSLGPLWVGLLPLALFSRRLGWKAWALVAYTGLSLLGWFLLSQQSRYLMPAFAPLAAVAALVTAGLRSRTLKLAAGVFGVGALAVSLVVFSQLVAWALPYATGREAVAQHLARDPDVGPVYLASEFVNTLPENARVATYEEPRGYYMDRHYFWANPGQHALIDYDRLQDGNALVRRLREFGITHVLINWAFSGGKQEAPYFRLLVQAIEQGRLREVFRTPRAEPWRRGVMVYELR
jgi:hypothetical protein